MSDRFLKHKPSGVVYIWQGVFANNPDFEECADAQGTPLPPAIDGECEVVEESPKPKKTKAKKVVEPVAEADDLDALLAGIDDDALSADASRGL